MKRALAIVAFVGVLLAVDTQVDARAQLLLGLAAWIALAVALKDASPLLRAQVLVVVPVATCAEVVGSVIWGVYTYRLENLPSFVPPCHGLVYLAGSAIAAWAAPRRKLLVRIALVAVVGWGIAGVTVLPRADVAGALGAILLAVYLVRGRAPAVYAGVFLVVAWLELYGTAIGTWEWAAAIPGTGVPQGNPPSGVASGYVWFDIVALAAAPRLGRLAGRWCARGGDPDQAAGRTRSQSRQEALARPRSVRGAASGSSSASAAAAGQPSQLGSANPTGLSGSARLSVSWRIAPIGTISSCGSPSSACGTSVRNP